MKRELLLGAPVAAALVALAAATGRASTLVGDCTIREDWPVPSAALAADIVKRVNAYRVRIGAAPLDVSASLTRSARWKASHMARYGYLRHDDPAPPFKRSPGERLLACGYPATRSAWGENIASGYRTPAAAMEAWLRSPGHRANMQSARWVAIGVGVAEGRNGRLALAQNFGSLGDDATTPPPSAPRRPRSDRVAPSAPRVSGPRRTLDERPVFRFAARDRTTPARRLRYRCAFDSPRLHACRSPYAERLTAGRHVLRVRALDPAGNASRVTTATTVVVAAADLALEKSVSPQQAAVGTDLTYTLTLENHGWADAEQVRLTDVLPAGVEVVSVSAGEAECDRAPAVACRLSTLTAGRTAVVTIVVRATAAGTLQNTGAVSATTADPVAVNNRATATATVEPGPPG